MANRGRNEGVRIVGDFVCEVLHDSAVPRANPGSRGRSEGASVIGEFVVDAENIGQEPIGDGTASATDREGAAFRGFVGGVLRTFGAVAASLTDAPPGQGAGAACRQCGRPDAAYRLKCCDSTACENCLSQMFRPDRATGVRFRCPFCGHGHAESLSA